MAMLAEMESPDLKQSYTYWKCQLEGCSPVLNFPYDYPRNNMSSGHSKREFFHFPSEISSELRQLSKNEGVSLFSTMLTTLGILMHKYSGDQDINIGTRVSIRSLFFMKSIVGVLVNSAVIRLKFEQEISFGNLLKVTHKVISEAIAHQDLSFEKIIEIVNPEHCENINPVFQVAFSWVENLNVPLNLDEVKSNKAHKSDKSVPSDITCSMSDNGDMIECEIEYNTDILKKDTIIRLWDNYLTLVTNLISNFTSPLTSVSSISESENRKLKEFNHTETSHPDYLVQGFFERQTELTPFRKAIVYGEETLTYKELDNSANQLAGHLIARGLIPGDIVAICLERSVGMVVSVLGVLKSGCCYLPLDPSFPDERLSFMFEDSGALALITQDSLKNKVKHFSNTFTVIIDKERDILCRYSKDKPAVKLSLQSQAYIIYTSGSTGKPKGVKIHHQAVVNFLNSVRKKPGFKEVDRLLAVTTLSFDISVFEIFVPLSFGGELVIASKDAIVDGHKLSQLLEKHNITVMQGTPATWYLLLGCGWKGRKNLKAICTGEAMTLNIAGQLLPRVRELWNMYGTTETTVNSTCYQITDANSPILIGKPIDNTGIHILDRNYKHLPVGVKGELFISGLGVAKGYINRPELTDEKFIHFDDDQIIYKTGDLGRYLTDGNIELFGRIDNQIKLRGFRMEPGEIETHLLNLKGVIESVVKVHTFEENDSRLVAFLNVDDEFEMTSAEIIRTLSRQLPSYMIPYFYQICQGFPRMPNGKIKKNVLHFENEVLKQKDKESFIAPSETFKKLVAIWEPILRIKNIRGEDNFFEIGGSSLLAISVVNKIYEEFGITLLFSELFINPTINQLGSYIDRQVQKSGKEIKLVHLSDTTNLPLSLNQKRIWLVSKLQPNIPTYNLSFTYELEGPVNRDILQHSLEILFHRHHVLFSVIKEVNNEPYCDIIPNDVKIQYTDYSELPEQERRTKILDFIDSESIRIFDLRNGPLYRLYLINSGNNKYFFNLSIHHIIFDGWSWPVFVNDLSEIYSSLISGKAVSLEKPEFQQYDYAFWESGVGHIIYDEKLIDFWKETLKNVPPVLNFPYDFLRKDQSSGRGGYEHLQLTQELSDKLRNISKEENFSLFGNMLGIYAIMLHKYSGEEDICIGIPVASRPHSGLENIIGMFVNTLVIRLKFERDYTSRDFFRITQRTLLEALAHQDLPFENVVEIVNPVRSVNINPLFQVCFAWNNNLNVPLKIDGVKSKNITGQEGTSVFDLTMNMWENGDIIEGLIEYNSDLLKRETIMRFRDNFLALAERLAENIDTPLSSISVISAEEQHLVLGYAGKQVPYPKDKTIVQLFEEQVKINPNKAAVVFGKSSLTYRELNERANQLARTLREFKVKPNIPVGVYADKSIEMIIGILGILKAGGAYLPLDPEYPLQRVNFIVNESGCKVILMQDIYMKVPLEGVKKIDLNLTVTYHRVMEDIEGINNSSDLAYIIYTSGTTGLPKGSMIRHFSVVRLVRNTNYIKLSKDDRILMTGAIVFDASTFEIWGSLLNGGTLYLVAKDIILSPGMLGKELLRNEITVLWLTSALFTQIAEVRTDIFSKLKYLLVGGDVLSVPHINKVRKDNPHLKIINGYGPTENTTFSTTFLIDKDFEYNIPIGKPVSNSTAYILDKYLNYQPIGVVGEIYIGGDGLSRGYLNREDLNRSRFIDHPFMPGERLYKTGDYGRWLTEGNIEFQGRSDNQIKIRGFRVELEEIESVISEIEGVTETVVKPVKMEDGDYKLIAFLNVPDASKISAKEIEGKIKAKLPQYMVPIAYRFIHGFRKTPNGKTDRNALHFEVKELESKETQGLGFLTPIERKIYDIWCNTLKTKEILTTDNFFELGGNSFLAISVLSKIESEFKLGLSLRNLFDYPSIRDISEFIGYSTKKLINTQSEEEKGKNKSKIIKGSV